MKQRILFTTILMVMTMAVSAQLNELGTFKCAALNVDGLPASVSIATYKINLNPDSKGGEGAAAIGRKAVEMGWDFFGVSEDFNYNTELMAPLTEAGYQAMTYKGEIKVSFGSITNYLASRPVVDTDGLNLIYSKDMIVGNEFINKWNDHYGYTDDGADGLINKGFRFYTVEVAPGIVIDVYILHMDAEVSEGDIAARESQMNQLVTDLVNNKNNHPKIVMGDTNCRYTRDKLKKLFIDAVNADERYTIKDCWIQKCKFGSYPAYGSDALMVDQLGYVRGEIVDKMFYINHKDSPYFLECKSFKVDTDFKNEAGEPLADHFPVVGEFAYSVKGDANNDGSVTLDDAGAVVDYYLGADGAAVNKKSADMDGNNVITVSDANAIVNKVLSK
ncbi:MAG: hypothetical protein KBT34_11545 [Prevotella sp.]|nr:hypothetical protein [Candidatus Prevotella equi]